MIADFPFARIDYSKTHMRTCLPKLRKFISQIQGKSMGNATQPVGILIPA